MKKQKLEHDPPRLKSLDALRGFDMLWIMGGKGVFVTLASITGLPFLDWWSNQLTHVEWHGFHAYDMIFPLFLFIAGVSFPFSAKKRIKEADGRKNMYRHIFKRGFLLVIIGIIYNNGISFDFEKMRFASVLGRIGLAWMFAALIFINTKNSNIRTIWLAGILLFYWLLFVLFKDPGYTGNDHFSMEGNIAGYLDRMLIPGRLCCYEFGENEGLLPTIAATGTGLLGMLTGELLLTNKKSLAKVGLISIIGVGLMILGQLWNLVFPINKILWSSSFVCWVGGLSMLLMALFYLVIDVWKFQKWAFFFVVIGMNPITIYLAVKIIKWNDANEFFFRGLANLLPETWAPFMMSLGYVAVGWTFLYFLYRKKIFLKV